MKGVKLSSIYTDGVFEYIVVYIEEHVCETIQTLMKEIRKSQSLTPQQLSRIDLGGGGWTFFTVQKRTNEFVLKRSKPVKVSS